MLEVYVHSHARIHGLSEEEILEAWENYAAKQPRSAPNEEQIVAVGFTKTGKDVQMIGIVKEQRVLIIHALHPVTKNVQKELGLL